MVVAAAIALVGAADATAQEAAEPVLLVGRTMGTAYRIKYWPAAKKSSAEVHQAVERLLAEFDRQMSTYRDDSELSRFNRAPAGEWFSVSGETAGVAAEALKYHELTGGVLDATVLPLLRLWNFGPNASGARALGPPSQDALDQGLQLVGAGRLQVRRDPPALWKDRAGVEVDLSSLAPGRAVDLIIELLRVEGAQNAMVEVGGEVRAEGTRPDGQPWRIGVESVAAKQAPRPLVKVVALRDLSLSTAGDYHNFRSADGRQYTHLIDPRSGQALPYRGAAVTVIAETCLEADALDTPLLIMGPEAGYAWCVERNIAALFQQRGEAGQLDVVKATPRFEELAGE